MRFDPHAALAAIQAQNPAEPPSAAPPARQASVPAPDDTDILIDRFLERAAIMMEGAGLSRDDAEAAALGDVSGAVGLDRDGLARIFAENPDVKALVQLFQDRGGPIPYGAAATALKWGGTRAWQADVLLRAAGLAEGWKP